MKKIKLKSFKKKSGKLIPINFDKSFPIKVKRFFYVYGKKNQVRGNHAHKKCTQIFIPIFGKIKLNLNDGYKKKHLYLNHKKNYGIIVPPKIWIDLHFLNKNSIVLVICDKKYEFEDYIDTYKKYLKFINKA